MLKFSFRKQVFVGFAFSIILVIVVGYLSLKCIGKLEGDTAWVDHSQTVMDSSDNLLQLLVDAETGMRGYGATGDNTFLSPYHAALPVINTDVEKLKELVADNPLQLSRVDSMATLVTEQLGILKQNVEARQTKGLDFMVLHGLFLNGKDNMDAIRALKMRLNNTETRLLSERKESSRISSNTVISTILIGSLVFLIIIIALFIYIQKTFARQARVEEEIKITNVRLEKVLAENEAKNWLLTGTAALNEQMQGQQTERELSASILTEVCNYTNAVTGTLYLFNTKEQRLDLNAYYAFANLSLLRQQIRLGEGQLGQAARSQKAVLIKSGLNEKIALETSIINRELSEIFIVPFFFNKELKGVMEIAFQEGMPAIVQEYILAAANDIGIAINTAQARSLMNELFNETQQQAEELATQQEEMRVTNEELLTKTEMLQASEEELRVQQEELRTTNDELKEKAHLLEEKNEAIEEARRAIDGKVNELEASGRYKSEFLANMSHELRTPLNSILVLARILKDNKASNLTLEQIKYASVIFNAGNDLLTLINDILDLSKIESGKLEMYHEQITVEGIVNDMDQLFAEVALNKKISFGNSIAHDVPGLIITDKVRVEQVLKNLLSNAFKFTPQEGTITIDITANTGRQTINFCVKDSGIGINADKQKLIFEAFQQADGSTSRKYGGTGLGLSISRELAMLLGGKITLKSEPGKGSEFTLTIPFEAKAVQQEIETIPAIPDFVKTDLLNLVPRNQQQAAAAQKEPMVVIVEDDQNFAEILKDFAAGQGYKSILVNEGTNAVDIIRENMPDAVILDIMLPGKDGWQILKELKKLPVTADIPVHLMSAGEAADSRVRRAGAISFMRKPIDTHTLDKLFADMVHKSGSAFKQILLVEDQEVQSDALKQLMETQGITVDQAFNGQSALQMLDSNEYQCIILDLNLPDISGLDLLDKIKTDSRFESLPVIVNTAMELDKASINRLMKYANAMVVKSSKSSERLIDEVNLFLHKITSNTAQPSNQANKTKSLSKGKEILKGKKVLIADDDMRNIFALSSALQAYDLQVEIANDGEEALAKLRTVADIDIVLMDIMMPKMDGYEATRQIRKQKKWAKLPVIALTAKAMQDDREKCIAAGANDYITKPVDVDRLVALMQLWLEN